MWLHGTTAYDIACVKRGEDTIGGMRFTIGTRADMSKDELARLPQTRLVEYGGRLWKQGGYEPTDIDGYAILLAGRTGKLTGAEAIFMDPITTDPIVNFEAPHRRGYLSSRFETTVSETSHIGRIVRSDRQASEARFQAAAARCLVCRRGAALPGACPGLAVLQ